jgi:hypothetical protein
MVRTEQQHAVMHDATNHTRFLFLDWHEIFRSFYKVLKIKVAVRDVSKIPTSRLMEFGGRNFMLSLSVCHDPVGDEANEDGDDPDDGQNALPENMPFPCAEPSPWVDARHTNLYRELDSSAHGKTTALGEQTTSTRRK